MSNVRNLLGAGSGAAELQSLQLRAMEELPDGIALLDQSGCLAYLNQVHVTMFGYEHASELIGQSWRRLYDSDEVAVFEDEYLPALERDGYWSGETRGRRADGSRFDIEVRMIRIGDDAISCIARDITHRRHAEQELSLYRHMVAATKAPMYFVDTDYVFREVNQAFLDIASKERSDLIGHHVKDLVGERHFLEVSKPDLDRCFAGEPIDAQRWVEYVSEERRFVDVHCDPSRNDEGEMRGAVISFRDVTKRKRLQDALTQSEQQLRAIFDNAPSQLFLKDAEGRFVRISKEVERIYNHKNDAAKGKLPHEVLSKEFADSARAHDLAVLESGKVIIREELNYVRGESDEPQSQLAVKFPLKDEDGDVVGLGGITTDITERIRAEDALRESASRFRNLIEGSLQGVCIHRAGLALFVNQACADIFGYESTDEIYAVESVDVLQAPYERVRLKEYTQTRVEGGLAPSQFEFDGVRRDGSIITLTCL